MTVLVSVLEPRSRLIPANLQEIPARLEQTDREEIPNYMTPLMHAAEVGRVDDVCRLLENGADANGKLYEHGLTALMFAAKGGHVEIVKLLLDAGADPNAVFTGHHIGFFTPLIMAITSDNKNRLEVIDTLIAGGAHLNPPAPYDGGTPLDVAIFENDIEMIKALLERGSDVNWEDDSGTTALVTAITSDGPNVDVVRLLLNAGADPNKPRIWTGNHCVSILKFLDDEMSRDKVTKEIRRLLVQAGGRNYAKKSHSDQCKPW